MSLQKLGDNVFHALSIGVPKGIRTPVTAVKGQCPRPLDDGDTKIPYQTTQWFGTFRISVRLPLLHQQVLLLINFIRQSVWTLHNAYLEVRR